MEHAHWRLILTQPAAGAWNMAVDEAILESISRKNGMPTLRLYSWDPPCLSLGYAQSIADVDMEVLSSLGWNLVRRPTGGRAILHTDELTYSIIAPPNEPRVAGGVLQSYCRLSDALLLALQRLGLNAASEESYNSPDDSQTNRPVCFEVPSNYEITVDGKKMIGSAQARKKEGILQHGALPLVGDLTRITQVLSFQNHESRQKAGARLLEHAATAQIISGRIISWKEAADAFIYGFEQALNLTLLKGELSHWEKQRAEELVEEKFGNPQWTQRL